MLNSPPSSEEANVTWPCSIGLSYLSTNFKVISDFSISVEMVSFDAVIVDFSSLIAPALSLISSFKLNSLPSTDAVTVAVPDVVPVNFAV